MTDKIANDHNAILEAAIEKYAPKGYDPAADDCTIPFAIELVAKDEVIANLHKQVEGRDKMLRQKDEAMGTLFAMLDKAGIDYSELIS